MRKFYLIALICFQSLAAPSAHATGDHLNIYIDADYTVTPAPAQAIELGLRTALAGTWAQNIIQIVPRDHRTNARRSFDTIQEAWRDPLAIAVVGGMQSPPYILHGQEINAGHMPLLLPWSAGTILTRMADGDQNWIFRLSVDDMQADAFLVRAALSHDCRKSSLAIIDNPWGIANSNRITLEFSKEGKLPAAIVSMLANSGSRVMAETVQQIQAAQSDCVLLVTGQELGANLVNALARLDPAPMVISHWGILGNLITEKMSYDVIQRVRLKVLGTCGLREARKNAGAHLLALNTASEIVGVNFNPEQHPAPYGFYHGHDLGLLIIEALKIARGTPLWTQGVEARRLAFRNALYELDEPVEGLLKRYVNPFRPVTPADRDGHEALGFNDLCLTEFDPDGHLRAAD